MKEMTEKIERENEELKRLTKELVEARKTQKDNSRATTQPMVHNSAPQFTNPIEFSGRNE
jgi:hypothetical protein